MLVSDVEAQTAKFEDTRIYDEDRLAKLSSGFIIQRKEYFAYNKKMEENNSQDGSGFGYR